MRILTTLPQDDLTQVPAVARAAEAAGYDGLVTSENKNDPFLAHGVAAVNTTRVGLYTGVAIAFSRSPMPVANASWDLQVASRGRFVLGLGSQVRAHNEKRFSVPWTAPAPRMREYVEALRAIWRCWEKGETLAYRGQHYTFTLMTPNFTPKSTRPADGARHDRRRRAGHAAARGRAVRRRRVSTASARDATSTRSCYARSAPAWRGAAGHASTSRSRAAASSPPAPDDESVAKMVEWVRYRVAFYALDAGVLAGPGRSRSPGARPASST